MPEAAVTTLWQHTGNLSPRQSRKLLVDLKQRSLVQLARTAETVAGSVGKISLHDLIHDYCLRLAQQRFGDESALHTRLLDAYRRVCPDGWWSGPDDGYFFNHLRDHLIAAGRGAELADLLHELRWLEAKNAAGLAFDLPHDFRVAMAVLSKGDARWRRLRLIDQALARDLHFIDRHREDYPQALFQCLWNNGWWYDCPAAAAHHDPPLGGWRGGGPLWPWDQRTNDRLATLLESWREGEGQRTAGFIWLESLRPPRFPLGERAELACLRGHEGWVTSVSFDRAGRRIVSGSYDNTVRVWDAESGACLEVIHGSGDAAAIAEEGVSHRCARFSGGRKPRSSPSPVARQSRGSLRGWHPITTHRSGRLWARAVGDYVCLIRLLGDAASSLPGAPES